MQMLERIGMVLLQVLGWASLSYGVLLVADQTVRDVAREESAKQAERMCQCLGETAPPPADMGAPRAIVLPEIGPDEMWIEESNGTATKLCRLFDGRWVVCEER